MRAVKASSRATEASMSSSAKGSAVNENLGNANTVLDLGKELASTADPGAHSLVYLRISKSDLMLHRSVPKEFQRTSWKVTFYPESEGR